MPWLRLFVLIIVAGLSSPEATPRAWGAAASTVLVAQGVDPTTLDPMNHQEAPATVLANNLFDGLIERDPDLNLVPLLAESYQSVSPTICRKWRQLRVISGSRLTRAVAATSASSFSRLGYCRRRTE